MRANPHLLRGGNKLWIRFFLLAVYCTMYIRDHARPEFHKALGIDIEEYDRRVLTLCSEISKQCFPMEIDLDNPLFWKSCRRLTRINAKMDDCRRRGGPVSWLRKMALGARAGLIFARLFAMPTKKHALPESCRLEPVW